MADKQIVVHHGTRVIASDGKTYTVACIANGQVYAYGPTNELVPIKVCGDAWDGENDQEIGLVA